MKSMIAGAICAFACLSTPAVAQERESLGWGRLFSNDFLGDNEDRWRTGSYVASNLRGRNGWRGSLPATFGELIELRFRSEIIAPQSVSNPDPADRRYVGALSFGVHSHFERAGNEMSLGLDLVVVGPQTGIDDFQEQIHDLVSAPRPNVDNFQVDNAVLPTLTFEIGRELDLGSNTRLRPFAEVQAGAETLARVGADLTFGNYGRGGLLLRDVSTGQRYIGIAGEEDLGLSFLVGADIAYVEDSEYLDTPGIVAEDTRGRVRAGIYKGWAGGGLFYGATYLSEEFESQSEGQVVGSLNVRFAF